MFLCFKNINKKYGGVANLNLVINVDVTLLVRIQNDFGNIAHHRKKNVIQNVFKICVI